LFRGSDTAREAITAREAARSAETAREADWLSRGMYAAGIFNALAAPFLTCSILRENPRSLRAWLVLLAVPVGCLLVLPILGPELGLTLPEGSLVERIAGFVARPSGVVTFAVWAETLWLGMIFTNHVTALPIGPITITLTPFAILPFWIGYYWDVHWAIQALLWAVCLFLGFFINGIRKLENERERWRRDQSARRFQNAVLGASERSAGQEFSLYLRPFYSTGSLNTQGSRETEPLDLETVLAKAVAPRSRLLALGRSSEGEVIGADRIYLPDSGWWPSFQKLAELATHIFILPSYRHGTLQEINWLIGRGYLTKCIFIMPETPSGQGWQVNVEIPKTVEVLEHKEEIDHAADWGMAAEVLKEKKSIALPAYGPRGAVFTFRDNASIRSEPLNLSRTFFRVARLRKAVRSVSGS
jgi:hypothetical protein